MKRVGKGLLTLAIGLALVTTACEKREEPPPGPAERAGEKLDQGAKNAGDAMKDAGKKMGEKMEDAGEKMKDASGH